MQAKLFVTILLFSISLASPVVQNNTQGLEPRIIDGNPESKVNYYEVAIVQDTATPPSTLCSGVLIKTEWVLTSAFCVKNKPVLRVLLGSPYIDLSTLGQEGRIVDKVIIHPYYNPLYLQHDIALLYVKSAINAERISIAALPNLPTQLREYVGQMGTISGFGVEGSNVNLKDYSLRYKNVQIIENAYCQNVGEFMSAYKLCSGGRTVCEGDQGGPLIIGNTVVGIASAALHIFDCESQVATSYTRVNYYRNWIDQTIRYNCN